MAKAIEQWFSDRTERPMTLARWGHYGRPVLLFPTAGGDAEEAERNRLLEACWDLVEEGRVKIYSCDSTAGRALATGEGSPAYRMWLLRRYLEAVAEEVVPAIYADLGGRQRIVTTGSSIGAFNAVALLCRHPDLVEAAIAMSGTFRLQQWLDWQSSEDLYLASPLHFLPGLQGPQLDMLRQRFVVLASGEGAHESIDESWAMARALGDKGIPNRVDNWGPEYIHDWPTWWEMLPQYLREVC